MLLRKLLATAAATAVAVSALVIPIGAEITNAKPWEGQESWTKGMYCENPYDLLSAEDVLKFTRLEVVITATAAGEDSSTVSGNVAVRDNWEESFRGYFGSTTGNWAESDYYINCYGIGKMTLSYELKSGAPFVTDGGNGGTMICVASENESVFSVDEVNFYDADDNLLNIPEPDYTIPINQEVCWTEGVETGNVQLDLSAIVPASDKIVMFGVRIQADYTGAEWQGVGGAISLELSTPIDGEDWYIIGGEGHEDESQWVVNSNDGIAYVKIPEAVQEAFSHVTNDIQVNVWWGSPVDETATLVELQVFCESSGTNDSRYKYVGDVDSDGKVDVADLSKLIKYISGLTSFTQTQFENSDLNNDGTVNIVDGVILIRIVVGIVEFPPILIGDNDEIGDTRDMTSQQIVEDMGIGWNLGNSLESYFDGSAIADETGWGNPVVTQELISNVIDYGFNSVRIPVTWMEHMSADGTVERAWLNRVETVVDYALNEGVYVIVNVHHDGGDVNETDPWIADLATQYDPVMAKFKKLWTQIAETFQNKSDYLIFEGINEVGFDSVYNSNPKQAFTLVNDLNAAFIETVRATGGNNPYRHLLIGGYWTDIDKTCEMLAHVTLPNDSRMIMSVHYYTPYQFCITGTQKTWGSSAEISTLRTYFGKMKTNFVDKGIPVIIGEYGFGNGVEAASARTFVDTVCSVSLSYGMCPMLWDNGEVIDRNTYKFQVSGLDTIIAKY